MNVIDVRDDEGRLIAIEIQSAYVTLRAVRQVLSAIPGLTYLKKPDRRRIREGVRLQFGIRDRAFEVWEPYSDSSRYWIGSADNDRQANETDVLQIRDAFASHEPSLIGRLLGAVLTLGRAPNK